MKNNHLHIILLLILVNFHGAAYSSEYIHESKLDALSDRQREFVLSLVAAFKTGTPSAIRSILHSSILRDEKCTSLFMKHFKASQITHPYFVKVEDGSKSGSLYFQLKHKSSSGKGMSFRSYNNVILENGSYVINFNCELARKAAAESRKYKDTGDKCAYEIKSGPNEFGLNNTQRSSNNIYSKTDMSRNDKINYCLDYCKRNKELQSLPVVGLVCTLNGEKISE